MSVFWEQGSPDLPACGRRRGSKEAQHNPSSSTQAQDPREGPSLAGRTTRSFLMHGLVRLAHEEAESSREGTSRGAMMQAMTTEGASRAPARAVSSFPLWCKGSKRRREHQAKASISVLQDQDQPNGREEVIVEPKQASLPEPLTGEDQL